MAMSSDGIGGPKFPVFQPTPATQSPDAGSAPATSKPAGDVRPPVPMPATPPATFEKRTSVAPPQMHVRSNAGEGQLAAGMKPRTAAAKAAGAAVGAAATKAGEAPRSLKQSLAGVAGKIDNPVTARKHPELGGAVNAWTGAFAGPELEQLATKAVAGEAAKQNPDAVAHMLSPMTSMVDDIRGLLEAIA